MLFRPRVLPMSSRAAPIVPMLLSAGALLACGSDTPVAPEPPAALGPAVYQLGTLQTTSGLDSSCPTGQLCRAIEVACTGVTKSAPAFVAVGEPLGTPRGVAVFFKGGSGQEWVMEGAERLSFLNQLRSDGFTVVQVRWATNWLESSAGNDAGTARLGCRPATAVKWIYETYFRPLGISRSETGRCGFCITGNSGGATQVSYPLSHYGLETILDAVLPTGGPPHAVMAKSCLQRPGEEGYWYPDGTRHFLDRGFGFFDQSGPCFRGDPSFNTRWSQESVATGGSDYNHPRTRVHFLFGQQDRGMQTVGGDYAARLRSDGSPWVTVEIAPSTPHDVMSTAAGRNMLRLALLASR